MEENIYQPPKADLTPLTAPSFEERYGLTVRAASTGQRFMNMLTDFLGYLGFSVVVGLVLGLTGTVGILEHIPDLLLGVVMMTAYYFPQEAIWGRTLGKLVTGTKAVAADGGPLTIGKALGRTLCRFIPFEAFSFLFGDGFPEGLHDTIPGTKVISLR